MSLEVEMQVCVLGPVTVCRDDAVIDDLTPKSRRLLAMLAARSGRSVSTDQIAEYVAGGVGDGSAVRTAILRLRKVLGEIIETVPGGYRLAVGDASVLDAAEFEQRVAAAGHGASVRCEDLQHALGLWRGEAFGEFANEPWARAAATRLEELRVCAIEDLAAAFIRSRRCDEALALLGSSKELFGYRERPVALEMRSLAGVGRVTDALRAFQQFRTLLHDDIGIEPTAELRAVEAEVVAGTNAAPADTSSRRPRMQALLFTDIEGSTALLDRIGDHYATVLARHQAIVRGMLSTFGGLDHGGEGDSFFATFDSPTEAIAAAVGAQRDLHAEPWPANTVVRVRMGLHVGEVSDTDAGLVGMAIHHAARIASSAHGGQIVVSAAMRELVHGTGAGSALLRLGRFRVRDVGVTELFQVTHPDLQPTFPALRGVSPMAGNVTPPMSTLFGRSHEVAEISDLVRSSRLVTLSGAGGSGKTRLATEVALGAVDEYVDGVWIVELAPLVDPATIASLVASVLGLKVDPPRSALDVLLDALHDRDTMIVLDNCEHVLDATATLADHLVRTCRNLTLMTTSREPLRIAGEIVYRVPSLACPPANADTDDPLAYDAVQLFLERTRNRGTLIRVDDDHLRTVAAICRRLDGMPLAIELAAARMPAMTVHEVHEQLSDRFHMLTGGSRTVLPRHQTLRALIDWSYDALSDRDKLALEHVSVFSGGFVLSDVRALFAALGLPPWESVDAIGSLVDKSLILAVEEPTGMRYDLLETVRQYALERLAERGTNAARAARDAHLEVFVDLAERERSALRGPDQRASIERLSAEVDNFREALRYGIGAATTRPRCARLAGALSRLQQRTGALREELAYLQQQLLDDESLPIDLRVDLLTDHAFDLSTTSIGDARSLAHEALELSREYGDAKLQAVATATMGCIEVAQGNYDRATVLASEALRLAGSANDQWTVNWVRTGLLASAALDTDPDIARQALEEALEFYTAERDHFGRGMALGNMGVGRLAAGQFDLARELLIESQQALRDAGTNIVSEVHYDLGLAAYGLNELDVACDEFSEALRIDIASGDWRRVGFDLLSAAYICRKTGHLADAARLHGASRHVMTEVGGTFEQFLVDWAERDVTSLRQQLGDTTFDQATNDGDKLSRRDAIELASKTLGSLRHQESA